VSSVSAFVLAGGKSSRMGQDKAFLLWDRQTLLAKALGLVSSLTDRTFIVGEKKKFAAYGAVVEDIYRDRGPLGGIHAALVSSNTELNLVLAVDLPMVTVQLLRYLVAQADASHAVVTVPHIEDRWQPLCAMYRRDFATVAEQALQEGRNKIDPLFNAVSLRTIDEQELGRGGFSPVMFRNLNTPEDLQKAQRDFASAGGIQ
jgi:molybdenum cofactor guanylyltransferase